tara:strand:- start:4902 stop:5432 length:531 start_codon:yes stop_codon:yes gene_type:complete
MKIFLKLLFLLILFGCGIQSTQYDIIKNNIKNEKTGNKHLIPEPNWRVLSRGLEKRVYAINHNSKTLFANDDLLIIFDGWNIVLVRGLDEYGEDITIENNNNGLSFFDGGNHKATLTCDNWEERITQLNISYTRKCERDSLNYENIFRLNQKKELTYLNFIIMPDKPPIEIYLKRQ